MQILCYITYDTWLTFGSNIYPSRNGLISDQLFQIVLQQLRSELEELKHAVEEAQVVLVDLADNIYNNAFPSDYQWPASLGKKK